MKLPKKLEEIINVDTEGLKSSPHFSLEAQKINELIDYLAEKEQQDTLPLIRHSITKEEINEAITRRGQNPKKHIHDSFCLQYGKCSE